MCTPSSVAIGEVHRNTKVWISLLESYYNNCYSLCWGNSRISKVTQVHFAARSSDGSDPHFCTHTLKDVWHQPIHAPEEEQTTAQWQVARTTTDNVQLSWSTFFCDVWHIRWAYRLQQVWELEAEGRFRAHCNTMYEDISEKILNIESCCLQSCRKKKTILYLKIVVLHIFAHCAAFAAAPTFKADFFLFCLASFTYVL